MAPLVFCCRACSAVLVRTSRSQPVPLDTDGCAAALHHQEQWDRRKKFSKPQLEIPVVDVRWFRDCQIPLQHHFKGTTSGGFIAFRCSLQLLSFSALELQQRADADANSDCSSVLDIQKQHLSWKVASSERNAAAKTHFLEESRVYLSAGVL